MGKEKEQKKHILDELFERYGNDDASGFSNYTQQTQKYDKMPDNQFGHAWSLINIKQGGVKEFDDLLNPHLFLGAIDDPKTLKFYQNDMYWLTSLFRLAKNDKMMEYVFEPLWHSFLTEVRLTGTLDGSERIYQAFKIPMSRKSGFKLFSKNKKKKEPMDYIIPQDDEEGMY